MKIRKAITAAAFTVAVVTMASALAGCSGGDGGGTASGGTTPADEPLTPITYQTFPQTMQTIPTTVAQEQGFFTENGLEVTFVDGTNGPAMLAAIAAGQVDVAGLPLFLGMQSIVSGAKIKAISGITGPGGAVVFVSDRIEETDAAYPKSAAVLEGKTAAIAAPGGFSERFLKRYIDETGVAMQYATIPGVPAQVAAMKAGQIDAMHADLVTGYSLTQQGIGHILWDFQETGPDELRGATSVDAWVSDAFLAEDPDAAEAFARSIAQAIAWMQDPENGEEVAEYVSAIAGIDVPVDDLGPFITAMSAIVSANDVEVYDGFFDEGTAPLAADDVLAPIAPQDEAAVEKMLESK